MFKKLLQRISLKLGWGCWPLTKHEILLLRLDICRFNDFKPSDVKNFWTGIEKLKGKVCLKCGAYLSQETKKCGECGAITRKKCRKKVIK